MGTYTSKYTGEQIDNLLEQVENGGGNSAGGSNPTGTIISFMGLVAPNGYLICDGAELNIADYSNLATHFETQFGTKNHFGGDGTTTFALPDLRNEFLRGYHNGASEQLSGEVGIHQNATEHLSWSIWNKSATSGVAFFNLRDKNANALTTPLNTDSDLSPAVGNNRTSIEFTANISSAPVEPNSPAFTSRPTNVAVLYCIKY